MTIDFHLMFQFRYIGRTVERITLQVLVKIVRFEFIPLYLHLIASFSLRVFGFLNCFLIQKLLPSCWIESMLSLLNTEKRKKKTLKHLQPNIIQLFAPFFHSLHAHLSTSLTIDMKGEVYTKRDMCSCVGEVT